jgi:hypothetical protein
VVVPRAGLALTAFTLPIPPETAPVCNQRQEGWRTGRLGDRVNYRNRSGSIDAPACTPGSAQGLRALRVRDLRASRSAIFFEVRAATTMFAAPVGPLRGTFVLGATFADGATGLCGIQTLTP